MIATVVSNPTDRDLKYGWIGANGMFVTAGQSVTLPYCVFTKGTPAQKAQMALAIESKMTKVVWKVRAGTGSVVVVNSIEPKILYKAADADIEKALATAEAGGKNVDADTPREKVIVAVGEGVNAVEDSKDVVQKATGQETVGLRKALGWEEPDTDDTRTEQKEEVLTMDEALTEGIGDLTQSPDSLLADALVEAPADEAPADDAPANENGTDDEAPADEAPAVDLVEKTDTEAPAKEVSADDAAAAKRSASAKKAAATRKANAKKKK